MSVDGYIAKPNDDLSFLNIVDKEGEDYGYFDFIKTVDVIIMGRKTYDWVVKEVGAFDDEGKDVYVMTSAARPGVGKIRFYTDDLKDLIKRLKSQPGQNIFCDGGAEIVTELLTADLIDEMIISVIPILVGEGIRLFKDGRPEQRLSLAGVKGFDTGLVQLHYKRFVVS
jgi:dihydrofolate reductase